MGNTEVAIKCPECGKFLAALEAGDTGVRVACHGLSIRIERQSNISSQKV